MFEVSKQQPLGSTLLDYLPCLAVQPFLSAEEYYLLLVNSRHLRQHRPYGPRPCTYSPMAYHRGASHFQRRFTAQTSYKQTHRLVLSPRAIAAPECSLSVIAMIARCGETDWMTQWGVVHIGYCSWSHHVS